MNLSLLHNLGLTPAEISIYSLLLERGELSASQIAKETKLKRGDCYNKIADLLQKGLVTENNRFKVKRFALEHPNKIEEMIDIQAKTLQSTEKELKFLLPSLVSNFNLSHHKPGVKIFEGEEGLEKAVEDSLASQSEIYSIVDPKAVLTYTASINASYVKRRRKIKKNKKLLVEDNSFNRKYFKKNIDPYTEVRFIDYPLLDFAVNMQMYDDKVTYTTLMPKAVMTVIIEDRLISQMQRRFFEYAWNTASPLKLDTKQN